MPWTTGIAELRVQLSDGPTDRYFFRKRCFGEVNGTNARFKTFEFRRITDFTLSAGVYIDGVLLGTPSITSDNPLTGEFVIQNSAIPLDGSIVEASYYSQWYLDSELGDFLMNASRWLLSSDDYTTVQGGLIPVALSYASSEAYKKMAQRWRTYMSDMYKVEDAPKQEADGKVDSFLKMAEHFRKEALAMRDEFYKRQGRSLQPLFGSALGRIRNMP